MVTLKDRVGRSTAREAAFCKHELVIFHIKYNFLLLIIEKCIPKGQKFHWNGPQRKKIVRPCWRCLWYNRVNRSISRANEFEQNIDSKTVMKSELIFVTGRFAEKSSFSAANDWKKVEIGLYFILKRLLQVQGTATQFHHTDSARFLSNSLSFLKKNKH